MPGKWKSSIIGWSPKPSLPVTLHAVGFGLHPVELIPLQIVTLNALQTVEEVEVPPGTAKFIVGDHMQAARTLLLNDVAKASSSTARSCPALIAAGELQGEPLDGIRA